MSYTVIIVKVFIIGLIALMLTIGTASSAFAHTTVHVEQFEIEVGWGIEPPIIGYRNDFVFEISEPGENPGVKVGIKNAFKNLDATAKFGGITKTLDIGSDPRPGHYFSHVIPTKTGSISLILEGEIDGVPIDIEIPVEDVESTAVLDFPPKVGQSADIELGPLKNAISDLQREVTSIKTGSGIEVKSDSGAAYDFAVLGLSIGSAAIILAVVSLVKRK